MALDGETPYDNANLYGFLMRHMAVIKSTTQRHLDFYIKDSEGRYANAAFYTTDGMRFELRTGSTQAPNTVLYENPTVKVCTLGVSGDANTNKTAEPDCGGCGSFGLNNNQDSTTKPPCLITVDVNGDKKPNPANINCKEASCASLWKLSDPEGKRLTDVFSIMITDKEAIPYGTAAQKAMYQGQK